MPSVTLCDIARLYFLSVAVHCDVRCTTLLMLISIREVINTPSGVCVYEWFAVSLALIIIVVYHKE